MPELPEVETVRAGLAGYLPGATVTGVQVHDARSLKRHPGSPADFVKTLTGAKFDSVVRRGKFLWLPITGTDIAMVGHLGMSGQMLIRDPGAAADKLNRVTINFAEPVEFRFVDQRIFGSLALDKLVTTADGGAGGFGSPLALIPSQAAHIARDPLDPLFDEKAVLAKLAKKHSGIKRVLLDQGVVSGIGNIYADEALWRTKLHYDTAASSISKAKASELFENVREILAKAVEAGGTSFDEQYKNVNGESGYFEVSLNAYGMTGRPCARCGTPIKRENWMNRGSHFCPKCQKRRA
jgi:formamidopyrimidine-DNA glycosylase